MSERLQELSSGVDRGRPKRGFGGWVAGRARRREYWLWMVPCFSATIGLAVLAPGWELILSLPILLVWIRRLHDLGWTGWIAPLINIAVGVIGFVEMGLAGGATGGLLQGLASIATVVVLGVLPGEPRPNEYGPAPGGAPDVAETFS